MPARRRLASSCPPSACSLHLWYQKPAAMVLWTLVWLEKHSSVLFAATPAVTAPGSSAAPNGSVEHHVPLQTPCSQPCSTLASQVQVVSAARHPRVVSLTACP